MKEGRSGHTTAYTVVTHDPRDREPVRPSGGGLLSASLPAKHFAGLRDAH